METSTLGYSLISEYTFYSIYYLSCSQTRLHCTSGPISQRDHFCLSGSCLVNSTCNLQGTYTQQYCIFFWFLGQRERLLSPSTFLTSSNTMTCLHHAMVLFIHIKELRGRSSAQTIFESSSHLYYKQLFLGIRKRLVPRPLTDTKIHICSSPL